MKYEDEQSDEIIDFEYSFTSSCEELAPVCLH
jgi:hypothetical protein